jgi:hypothetical protein
MSWMPTRIRLKILAAVPLVWGHAVLGAEQHGIAAPKFQSSAEYMQACAGGQSEGDCRQAFVAANNWVRFNSDAKLCLPDEKTSFGSREYAAAMNDEAVRVIGWLKDNPKSAGLDYVQSVGQGLIALYTCK